MLSADFEEVTQHVSERQLPVAFKEPVEIQPQINPRIERVLDFTFQDTKSIREKLKREEAVEIDLIDAVYLLDSEDEDPESGKLIYKYNEVRTKSVVVEEKVPLPDKLAA